MSFFFFFLSINDQKINIDAVGSLFLVILGVLSCFAICRII